MVTQPVKQLDDYQIESRDFLLADNFRLLADEPGVGKTGPSIMAAWKLLKEATPRGTALITVPAYLIPNWKKEIRDFIPHATVVSADGAGYPSRRDAFAADVDFVLTSYNNWSAKSRDGKYIYGSLIDRKWSAYIFDEGHRLRGRNSSWTKHVFRTRLTGSNNRNTPIWLLTGTPFVRDGGDFFPYFHLYDKKKYSSYWKFVGDRCVIVETPWAKNVGNIRKAYAQEFREELAQFSLRRTVSDIPSLASLEFVETDYQVTLPPSVVAMIKKAKKEYVLEHSDLASPEFLNGSGALYVAQRKIATDPPTKVKPKLDWLKDFLQDKKGKVIVWTWYKESAKMVSSSLGSNAVLISGDTPVTKRAGIIDSWREPKGPQVLVATIPSMNTGLTLTECNEMVFLEHCELPSENEQAIKRACRRGQTKVVQVHNVYAKDSVDMAIKACLKNRNLGIQDALAKWAADVDCEDDDWFT